MLDSEKILSKKKHLRFAIAVIGIIITTIFTGLTNDINKNIENFFYKISGETKPDSNIILINIDSNDLNKLAWPLKRNYYALLINELTALEVKTIGIEIFLADNLSFQSIYNELLNEEIRKSGRVVLGSIVSNIIIHDDGFYSDSIIYPQPKKFIKDVNTGHLIYFDDDGITIPTRVVKEDNSEYSFSVSLAKHFGKYYSEDKVLKLNINTSWKNFSRYSLLNFFSLLENNDPKLNTIKNKLILIGVSDPAIARTTSSSFDDQLPGVGLHAIALDNIFNDRGLKSNLLLTSTFFFYVLILLLVMLEKKRAIIKSAIFISVIIISVIFFISLNSELNYTAFFIPFILLLLTDISFYLIEKRSLLYETMSESEILKMTLSAKEENLSCLQKELDVSSEAPAQELVNKISSLKNEIRELKESQLDEEVIERPEFPDEVKSFFGIVYKSRKMEEVIRTIEKVAPEDVSVLILGESGSGKELVANAIHKLSKKSENNFVAVNCAALTETLLESELFGHIKGAFTNAVNDKTGMFEAADKGTIFLDEIGETSENFQVKLLRVLQTGDFNKVGDADTIHTDVRVIAATNKKLEELVREKKFREDLYYRINVISITLPPLRDRKEDVAVLANHFTKKEDGKLAISKAVLNQILENDWKGNVRELESVIKRAAIFAKSEHREVIKLCDLPPEMAKQNKSNLESLILDSLREKSFSHASINETAKELGDLSRTIVSENFRGIFFKYYYETNFNLKEAAEKIAGTKDISIISKVESKITTYLTNIEKDIEKQKLLDFDEIKKEFKSKYKNLPQRYHHHLDELIKDLLS